MSSADGVAGPTRRRAVSPARAAAFDVLGRLRRGGARLDDSVAVLPELSALGAADRGLANELVIGTVKRRASLDAVLGAYTKAPLEDADPDVRDVLRLAAFQLLFLDRVPAYAAVDDAVSMAAARVPRSRGFVNAVLRRVAGEGRARLSQIGSGDDDRSWAVRLSYPRWLVRLLRDELGDVAADRLLDAANGAPERCLRANGLRGGVAAAVGVLESEGYETAGAGSLPDALLYDGPPLERSRAFADGVVTPQSRGSQIAGLVTAGSITTPGARVLDLCASPGAKTSQLAALLPDASLTAVEVDEARAAGLRANLARLGATAVDVVRADAVGLPASWDGSFDAVLVDAPCSGLGTLASRPDLRWRRRKGDVQRLAGVQARLLARAASLVRPGGSLTYAVCTVTRAETVAVVDPLLAGGGWAAEDLGEAWPGLSHPDAGGFLLVLPPDTGSTGFFIARLRREAAAGPSLVGPDARPGR